MRVLANPFLTINDMRLFLTFRSLDTLCTACFFVDHHDVDGQPLHVYNVRLSEENPRAERYSEETLWEEEDDRTPNPIADHHAGLREYISSRLVELMLRGFILEGSYAYDGKTWNFNQAEPESFDLPDLEPVA